MKYSKEELRDAFYRYLVGKNISGVPDPEHYGLYTRMAHEALITLRRERLDQRGEVDVALIETCMPLGSWELKLYRRDGEARMGAE